MTPERRTGRTATCPKCGRPDVPTEWRGQLEVLALHPILGGEVTCHRGSARPVDQPDPEQEEQA